MLFNAFVLALREIRRNVLRSSLTDSQRDFARGLRMFAADFGRARATTRKGDMGKATQQLTDKAALRKIQVAAKRIDDLCGA